MFARAVRHVRGNAVAWLALFVALGGSAYAANTVGSADIIDESILSADIKNGEVKTDDVLNNAITSVDIATGGVANSDLLNGAITEGKLALNSVGTTRVVNGSLLGADVAPNTLTGTQISEGTLGKVNDADTVDGLDSTALTAFGERFGNGGSASAGVGSGPTCTLAEIALTATSYALPTGFVPAHGQTFQITQETALFALLGTAYGGDGETTFEVPDMRPIEPDQMTYGICIAGDFPSAG